MSSTNQQRCSCVGSVGKCCHMNESKSVSDIYFKQKQPPNDSFKRTSSPFLYLDSNECEKNWGVFDAMHSYSKNAKRLESVECERKQDVYDAIHSYSENAKHLDSIEGEKKQDVYDAMQSYSKNASKRRSSDSSLTPEDNPEVITNADKKLTGLQSSWNEPGPDWLQSDPNKRRCSCLGKCSHLKESKSTSDTHINEIKSPSDIYFKQKQPPNDSFKRTSSPSY